MNTKSLRVASAAVIGARHARDARNGQDAAASWCAADDDDAAFDDAQNLAVVVVCDGCGSGASSEVGARLGARAVLGSIVARLKKGSHLISEKGSHLISEKGSHLISNAPEKGSHLISERVAEKGSHLISEEGSHLISNAPEKGAHLTSTALDGADGTDAFASGGFWDGVRADIVAFLADIAQQLPGTLEDAVHDYLLFTIVAAVVIDDTVHVWAVGDGAYAIDGAVRELGPFVNNQPPYIAYDLIGKPTVAHEETTRVRRSVLVATDGAAEMRRPVLGSHDGELEIVCIATDPAVLVSNPDALRRFLAKRAKGDERIDWDARRVIRTHAALQDDGAVGLIVRDEEVLS